MEPDQRDHDDDDDEQDKGSAPKTLIDAVLLEVSAGRPQNTKSRIEAHTTT